jgi:CheY-like chemotaxis protein
MHGGDISAESQGRHQGAIFTVTLPLGHGTIVEAGHTVQPQGCPRLRLVVIEDNDDIRETLVDLLESDGHDVRAAREGTRGAALIMETCPDVAIVDVGLPGMDGYAVARAVRGACGRSVRLIALTGYGRREDRRDAKNAGFDRHIVKPVDHEVLTAVLAELSAARPRSLPPQAHPATNGHETLEEADRQS